MAPGADVEEKPASTENDAGKGYTCYPSNMTFSPGAVSEILQITSDAVVVVDSDDCIKVVSASLGKMMMVTPEDVIGKTWYEIVVPAEDKADARQFAEDVLSGRMESNASLLLRLPTLGEDVCTIKWACIPLGGDKGGPKMAMVGEILSKESDLVEHHLHQMQLQYQSVVDNIATGVAVISPDMEVVTLNRQMQEWFPDVQPADRPMCYKVFCDPPGSEICSYCPTIKTLTDGKVHWALTDTPAGDEIRHYKVVSSPITDPQGNVIAAIEMVDDVTERIRSENALWKSEARFRSVFEQAAVGVGRVSREFKWLEVNQRLCEIVGYSKEELLEKTFEDITHPEDLTSDHMYIERMLSKEISTYSKEKRYIHKDGSWVWINLSASAVTDADGEVEYFVSVIEDITERRLAEEQLHDLAVKYSTMMDAVPAMLYVKDNQGRFTAVNQAFREFCNKSDDGILGHTSEQVFETPESRAYEEGDEDLFESKKKVVRPARRCVGLDGVERWMSTTKVPLFDADSEVIGLVGLVQDVTEAHRSREQLVQADKLAAIGTLAAGVAHEINNPIGFIASNLNTMSKYLGKISKLVAKQLEDKSYEGGILRDIMEDFQDAVDESREGAERVKDIVADLKSFSRVDRSQAEYASINDGIATTLNIVWNELKYKCTVEKDFGELPDLYCRLNQLNQVFMNLLINASHAIDKEPGVIKIRTWTEDESIVVSIKDNGKGIPPEQLSKIFEPFFTTKEVGKGTGLGLSLAYDIVTKHNGSMDVRSEVGVGTEFIVTLPIGGLGDE